MFKEPKLYNGFASRKFIMNLIKKAALEEAKKKNRNKPQRVGKMWNAR